MTQRIVVDCAGAMVGGAARFLRELQIYLAQQRNPNIELIGLGRQLSPQWLVQRELQAATATSRVSLNNVGFVNPRGKNITLLRNILQFARADDYRRLRFVPSRRLRTQTPVVRTLAKASDTLVVPCTRMAQQVADISPGLQNSLVVRFHPITQPCWAGEWPRCPRSVLLPIVPSPYKHLDEHIPEFLAATQDIAGEPITLVVPTFAEDLPELASHPQVQFIGPQSSEALEMWWKDCGAVLFPTEFESFGYPLAEGRVYGRHVIAQDTAQNQEIAGPALRPYIRHDAASLRAAIEAALNAPPTPDPTPFDPQAYFQWLLHEAA
ncbi:MAG TPA: glycosyltransferase [Yaniella sp.]